MVDDIDIGIGIHDDGGAAIVDAMREKLASYRAELQQLAEFEAEFGGRSGAGLVDSLRTVDAEVADVVASFAKMGAALDVSNTQAVAAFRAEATSLRDYIEQLGAAGVAIDRINGALVELSTRQRNAAAPAAAASNAPLADNAAAVNATDLSVQKLATDVNVAIGGFQRMGELVDVTSAAAVAAFRAEGDALAANLAGMGATDAELNKIGSTIARVEQQMGAYNASLANNALEMDRMPIGARRGANAIATLTFGLAAGGTSARTMAISLGSMISALAQFSDRAAVAASATGIGALVTVLAVVIGLFYDLNKEEDKSKATLGDLSNLTARQLKQLSDVASANAAAAAQRSEASAAAVEREANSLNAIDNIRATFHTFQARKDYEYYQQLQKIADQAHEAYIKASKAETDKLAEDQREARAKAAEAETDNAKGPLAAQRLAAKNELDEQLRKLALMEGTQQQHDDLAVQYRRQYAARLQALDREQADQERQLFERLQNERLQAESKLDDDVYQVQRDAENRRYEAEVEGIDRDRNLGAKAKQARIVAEQAHTANLADIEKNRREQIHEIVADAQGKLDVLQNTDVNEAKIRQQYKKQIDVLNSAIASEATDPATKEAARQGIALIQALIPEEVAKARLDEIERNVSKTVDAEQQDITRTNDLLQAHQLTDQQARERIVDAMIKQRDAVAASIPLLQQQADALPGDADAQAKVEAYKTKLLELNIAIQQASDSFYQLKQAGLEATQSAIERLLTSIPDTLLNQGAAINNINAIRTHLASAQAELNALMNAPPSVATNQRITQLRTEIQNVNSELGRAKSELVTWKTLFLDAARSIVQALFQVEARMFAVHLVQQTLALFNRGSGNSAAGAALQVAGDVAGVFAADGGYIRGPGSSTSDSIPARLSNGEYVVNARAVSALGVAFLDAVNAAGRMPVARARGRGNGYAAGGLVASASNAAEVNNHLTVGLEDGLVLRHLESSAGDAVLLKFAERNSKKLRNLLGNR